MSAIIGRFAATVSLAMVLISFAWAQPLDPLVCVTTFDRPPFVMQQRGALTGFSMDLWNEIATKIGVKTSYQIMPDVKARFDSVRSGNADIARSGLSYRPERDRESDFSYPIMEVDLQSMVRHSEFASYGHSRSARPERSSCDARRSGAAPNWIRRPRLFAVRLAVVRLDGFA